MCVCVCVCVCVCACVNVYKLVCAFACVSVSICLIGTVCGGKTVNALCVCHYITLTQHYDIISN